MDGGLARVKNTASVSSEEMQHSGICQSVIVTKKFATILFPTMIVFLTLASAGPQYIANQDGVGVDKEVTSNFT